MRFAVYHPWVYLKGGMERTVLELFSRSRHEWVLFTHHYEPAATFPQLREFHVVELEPRVSVRRQLHPLVGAASVIATCRLPMDGARALLVSSEGLGDFVLARNRVPAVCYCHTPLKILFDPKTRAALEFHHPAQYRLLWLFGPAYATADRLLWRRYRHIFANSHETQRRIGAAGLRDPAEVEVLRPGVDHGRFSQVPTARAPYFLVAGRIMWQKNIELAIDALAFLLARQPAARVRLVVAGAVDEKSRPYLRTLRREAARLPVTFEVDPSDRRLTELYSRALAVLFTARNEDFGLVPLEAMAAGAPVIAVDAGGPRETVVDGRTGWLLAPQPEIFAARMAEVLAGGEQLLAPLRDAARRRAAEWDWRGFVDRVDDVMEQQVT